MRDHMGESPCPALFTQTHSHTLLPIHTRLNVWINNHIVHARLFIYRMTDEDTWRLTVSKQPHGSYFSLSTIYCNYTTMGLVTIFTHHCYNSFFDLTSLHYAKLLPLMAHVHHRRPQMTKELQNIIP